jgi:hypothetical protein
MYVANYIEVGYQLCFCPDHPDHRVKTWVCEHFCPDHIPDQPLTNELWLVKEGLGMPSGITSVETSLVVGCIREVWADGPRIAQDGL